MPNKANKKNPSSVKLLVFLLSLFFILVITIYLLLVNKSNTPNYYISPEPTSKLPADEINTTGPNDASPSQLLQFLQKDTEPLFNQDQELVITNTNPDNLPRTQRSLF